jgi:hypothetical protein
MSDPNTQPQSESDYAEHLLWRMTGSKITSIGANQDGEIYISTDKGVQVIIGKDENGEISLFELVTQELPRSSSPRFSSGMWLT